MKKILTFLSIFLLLQNASFAVGVKSTMTKIMDSWIGENINTVTDTWGYPTSEKVINKRKLYYWTESHFAVQGNQYNVYGEESYCTRILEVDNEEKVTKWQWEGNNCPVMRYTGKKWVNPYNDPWQRK